MINKQNTALFALLGVMGALIVIGAYLFAGSTKMFSTMPSIALSAFPVFLGSIFSGLSLATAVKEKEKKFTKQSIPFSDSMLEMNQTEHSLPSYIDHE